MKALTRSDKLHSDAIPLLSDDEIDAWEVRLDADLSAIKEQIRLCSADSTSIEDKDWLTTAKKAQRAVASLIGELTREKTGRQCAAARKANTTLVSKLDEAGVLKVVFHRGKFLLADGLKHHHGIALTPDQLRQLGNEIVALSKGQARCTTVNDRELADMAVTLYNPA